MNLEALSDFNLVASFGGFAAASRATNRPKATLSRHVQELEQSIGVRLIERSARGLHLTDEGRGLYERTEGLLAELKEAGEAVAARAPVPRGKLRVSAPVVFAHVLLSSMGARFAIAFPQVQLEIVADDRIVDPVEDGFDLVVRINPSGDDRLVGRRVLSDERWLVAAASLSSPLNARAPSREIEVRGVMMSNAKSDVAWHVRGSRNRSFLIKPEVILTLSSLLMVKEAVLSGIGTALLPRLLVEDDVKAGRLTRWAVEEGGEVEIWALYSSRRLLSAKVRAFMNWLVDDIAERKKL
jgi:DNA-binding transcriptional LysR family regulator